MSVSEQVNLINKNITSAVDVRAFTALIIGAIAIGSSPIFVRFADVTPTSSAFWRLALAIPPLLIWQLYDLRNNKRTGNTIGLNSLKDYLPFVLCGFFFAADLSMWHWSLRFTSVANSTLLANMAAIFTAVGGFLLFGERFSKTFIAGMLLALMGAASLMGHSFELNPENLFGDVLSLATAVVYAGYMIVSARARKKFSTVSIMLGTAIMTCVFLFPIAMVEVGDFVPTTFAGWWPLIGLGWFTHMIGQSLILYALAHLSAALGSTSLLIQPVIASILAWVLFNEVLGIYHVIGAVLIIAGIMICKKGSRK